MSEKIRVAVLYGGRSSEHEVSLKSAVNVIEQLDRSLFEVIPIGIDKQGTWFLGEEPKHNQLSEPSELKLLNGDNRQLFNPDWIGKSIVSHKSSDLISRSTKNNCLFDVVFPVMHGTNCEDGTMQGLLELADVPYVGCGVLTSAIGMDKDISKRLAKAAGINVHPYIAIQLGHWQRNADAYCDQAERELGYPMFVKPANTGSSVGVEKVKSREQLRPAIEQAFMYDTKILVEKGLDAREIELAVMESTELHADPFVSNAGEVCYAEGHEFFSYDAKYLDERGVDVVIPADISDKLHQEAKELAKKIFHTLGIEGMARIDLFLDRPTQTLYFNEINTLPGFTALSVYPKLMQASGVSYSEILTRLVMLAIARHKRKSKLHRSYSA